MADAAVAVKIREHLNATKRVVAYYPALAEISGGAAAALMLAQALFLTGRTKNPDGWFYKSREEWQRETGLTRWEQETARRNLRERKLLYGRLGGNPRRLYYCVNMGSLAAALASVGIAPAEKPPAGMSPAARVTSAITAR